MKRPHALLKAFALSSIALVLALVAAEGIFRLRLDAPRRAGLDGYRRHLLTGELREYEARAYTVFQRPPSAPGCNSCGFRGEEWPPTPTPGVPRVVCMGGSTTEGGNSAGLQGAYPFLLERVLEERTGRDFEVFNAGISGWTTAEMVAAWFLTLQDFDPDVVVIHEAVNDLEPRFRANFRPDYSHWRRPIQIRPAQGLERLLVSCSRLYVFLQLKQGRAQDILAVSTDRSAPFEPLVSEGKLPRATSFAFRRNVRNIALSAAQGGATVVLMTLPTGPADVGEFWRYGVAENNQHLRELCTQDGFELVDAARAFEARPEMTQHFTDMVHLEPSGNRLKAELVADGLAGWLAALSPQGARPPP